MRTEVFLSYMNQVLGVDRVLVIEDSPRIQMEERRPFHIFVEAQKFGKSEKELLAKIVEALKWPENLFMIHEIDSESQTATLENHLFENLTAPINHLYFGLSSFTAQTERRDLTLLTSYELPGLQEMIHHPHLKKEAWNKLKPLVFT